MKQCFSTTKEEKFQIVYILKILQSNEDAKNIYEYNELPLTLLNEIKISDDKDIALFKINEILSINELFSTSTSTSASKTILFFIIIADASNEMKKTLKKFLKEAFRFSRKKCVLQDYFQRNQKMLTYHDDFDVFDQKKLLQ